MREDAMVRRTLRDELSVRTFFMVDSASDVVGGSKAVKGLGLA